MTQATLQELFVEQIQDLYDAEKQLVKAIPKMADAVESEELANALREHLAQTENQVTRLENIFEMVGSPAKGKTCKAMKGLIEEGGEAAKEKAEDSLRDLAVIAGAQRVEHYEISAYGTARTLAERLGLDEAADLLQETEDEERDADATLTGVAMTIYGTVEDAETAEKVGPTRASASSKGMAKGSVGGTRRVVR